MSYTQQYRYVGRIDGGVREAGFPLICGFCSKDIALAARTFVYFDMGPGDFFLVDQACREIISDDHWAKKPERIRRQLAQKSER